MLILGINAFHADAAAVILRDGKLVAAVEEERLRRVKHWAGFPAESIRWCLAQVGATLRDVDAVAINSDASANTARKVAWTLAHRPDPRFVLDKIRNKRERRGIEAELARAVPGSAFGGTAQFVEHHLAHMASAYFASPFDTASVISVDGFGDFASGAWGLGVGTALRLEEHVWFPHSLGAFYTGITQFLGFPHYGDEYKVMGLAPYGTPRYLDAMRQVVTLRADGRYALAMRYFRHGRERLANQWSDGAPVVGVHWAEPLAELLGPARVAGEPITQRHQDIARSAQAMFEEALFHMLRSVHALHGMSALALSGGCAMNSVAAGRITQQTPFTELYVPAAPGDAGGALGAALMVWHAQGGTRSAPLTHAYWGPDFTDDAVQQALTAQAARWDEVGGVLTRVEDEAELARMVAQAIADGEVVGWMQGRLEWGPRALGNRSILADPRRADMQDILNHRIKRRESFRPFAPSVLREAVGEWFEADVDVPFMSQVLPLREAKRALVPAVAHVDGSGRLHTVCADANPRYHRLLRAFADLTGVPMLVNTSFNENEPIVCTAQEAVACFLRTEMDRLVLGNVLLTRRSPVLAD